MQDNEEYVQKLEAVFEVAEALVNLPPYPWNRRRRRELTLELASKVNDIRLETRV